MKNVIITGAANGVGKAVSNILKDENLILIDIDKENLSETAKETNSKYYICDISDDEQILNTINEIETEYKNNRCMSWIDTDRLL